MTHRLVPAGASALLMSSSIACAGGGPSFVGVGDLPGGTVESVMFGRRPHRRRE